MKKKTKDTKDIFEELFIRYPKLVTCRESILKAYKALNTCYKAEHKLLVAGNGGSASDAEHIVGELMKSFLFNRKIDDKYQEALEKHFVSGGKDLANKLEGYLPAIPLTSMPAISTAFANDVDPSVTFAQLVFGYGLPGDVFLGISTSGNSKNILYACMAAKAKNITTIGLTGASGGKMNDFCDIVIHVPEDETFKIQELHLPVYHALCAMLEADFFVEK